MSTLMQELTAIKAVEDKLTANKVANFAYTEHAYNNPLTEADGVETYDVDAEQNIPVANADILKVNATVLTKGWRAQASSITRMLMNHFLGRCSYNLNKLNDLFSLLLAKLMAFMGQPHGLATLDSRGRLIQISSVGDDYTPITRSLLTALFGRLLVNNWTKAVFSEALTSHNIFNVCYLNELWIAGGDDGLFWSADGKEWTKGTGIDSNESFRGFYNITYGNGLWVVGGTKGLWWSEDGKSWTAGTGWSGSSPQFNCVVYYNDLFLACSFSTSDGVLWSADGKTWTPTDLSAGRYNYVKFNGAMWVAVGTDVWWSNNGKNWTQGTGSISGTAGAVDYADGKWVLATSSGLYYSSDGKAWVQGADNATGNYTYVSHINGRWFAGGIAGGATRYSFDGSSWTDITVLDTSVSSTPGFSSIAYANGLWLGTVLNSYMYYSYDGAVWFLIRFLDTEEFLYAVKAVYANNIFVVCSATSLQQTAGREIWYSSIDELIADGLIDLGTDIPIVNS